MTAIGLACFALGFPGGIACGIAVGLVGGLLCDAVLSSYCGDPIRWLALPCDAILGEVCSDALKAAADGVGIALGLFLCPIFSEAVCSVIPK